MKILRKPINHLNYHVYMNEQMSEIRFHLSLFFLRMYICILEEDFHTHIAYHINFTF